MTKYRVCPTCGGSGSIVNPAVDGGGLTAEDFEREGPEFEAAYFGGVYDQACPECGGQRVVTQAQERDYAERVQDLHTARMESGVWDL